MTSPRTSTDISPAFASPALGWLLLLPALLGTLITLLLPTVQTILLSLQSAGLTGPSVFVGLANYGQVLGQGAFWKALVFTLSITVIPLLVAVVVGPLLALALDWSGAWPRRAGRIVLSLALVAFSPVAVAVSWMRGLMPDASGLATMTEGVRDPATAPGTLQLILAAATFGVVCALATMAFLPALRGGTVSPAMLAVGGLVALAMVAAGLQTFAIGLTMTHGGPNGSTQTLSLVQYTYTFMVGRVGLGATVATVMGLVLGVLGIGAVCVAAASGMRITIEPRGATPDQDVVRAGSGAKVIVGVAALVVVAAVGLALTWPWLSALLAPAQPGSAAPSGWRTVVNTWAPALIGALVSVGVAYLGALGIGGLRPLGRRSEWLLLVFAPWLFVGMGPLSLAGWRTVRGMSLIDSFVALVQPVLVSVPALLILTLLCKGLAARTGKDFLGGVVLPSLPMAGILVLAVTLVNGQELLWPLLVAQDPGLATAPVQLLTRTSGYTSALPDVGLATPLAVVAAALIGIVAAQLLYLDRLAITVGRSRADASPA
ncbi:carbohydrate ABC transporter permease [Nonomuraea sp. NPDC050022]|uniref:carbohydrate ABC transporter permease n=1 Tax=Nonomuraea sp. NPDC050022 TaxID=3364358 RepID=UPI0037A1E6C4